MTLDYKFDDPKDPNRIYFRSDHYNVARKGVPILFFYDGMLQEIEEEFGLAAAGPEMNVADPDRTVVIDRRDRIHPKPCDW